MGLALQSLAGAQPEAPNPVRLLTRPVNLVFWAFPILGVPEFLKLSEQTK